MFLIVLEAFAQHLFSPDMKGVEAFYLLPVRQVLRPLYNGAQVQGMDPVFELRDRCGFGEFQFVNLLMKKRGHQQKSRVLESESIPTLCDSTFPQNDALPTGA